MTKQEQIKKMINTCNSYHSCALCPYNPEDISRFIGDKWIGGCPNYDRKIVYAMSKGYRKIDDDCAVITKAELKQYKVQAVREFAEKLKSGLWNCTGCYIPNCFESPTDEFAYSEKDLLKLIYELLKEYEVEE